MPSVRYSLGMRQRLSVAGALLGEPNLLVLDEPANGLDPEGIRWLRDFLRTFAADGKTVFISSHVLGEMQQLVDEVVIIHHGKLDRARPGQRAHSAGSGRHARALAAGGRFARRARAGGL